LSLYFGEDGLGQLDFKEDHEDSSSQETGSSKHLNRDIRVWIGSGLNGTCNRRSKRRGNVEHKEDRKCRRELFHLGDISSDSSHHGKICSTEETINTGESNETTDVMSKWPYQEVTSGANEHSNDEHIQATNIVTEPSSER
jgi:hypothetical protein